MHFEGRQKISCRNCIKPRNDMIYYCPDSVPIQAYFYLHTVNLATCFPSHGDRLLLWNIVSVEKVSWIIFTLAPAIRDLKCLLIGYQTSTEPSCVVIFQVALRIRSDMKPKQCLFTFQSTSDGKTLSCGLRPFAALTLDTHDTYAMMFTTVPLHNFEEYSLLE